MHRRDFLRSSLVLPATLAGALAAARPSPAAASDGERWRTFEVVTRVEVQKPAGVTQVWIPVPLSMPTGYFASLGNAWSGNATQARLVRRREDGSAMFHARWDSASGTPRIELTSRFAARDRAFPARPPAAAPVGELRRYLQPTEYIPTDGIVRDTARKATRGARGELAKARAIYDWVVENTFRDPKVRGCGWGDVKTMLETGNLGGKCGDLNALFVGLARAVGIPARDVYGLRVAPSQWGYRSMSASGAVTAAQHCRAEFYLDGSGWVAVDPADVRKVALEEPPGHLGLHDPRVALARERLFGAWEMNWCAYNTWHDVRLPGSDSAPLPYFMYPAGETRSGRKDSLDPGNFRYAIEAHEIGV